MTDQGSTGATVLSLWHRAETLVRHRYFIVTVTLAMAVLAGAFSLLRDREYRATARFLVYSQQAPRAGLNQLAAQFGIATSTGAPQESNQFYADLLGSAELMKTIIVTRYDTEQFQGDLIEYYGISSTTMAERIIGAMRQLRRDVTVHSDRLSGILTLGVDTPFPELSAAVAEQFLELLNDYNINRRQSRARAEREFLEKRVKSAAIDLANAEDSLVVFYVGNRLWSDSPELLSEEARLKRRVQMLQDIHLQLAKSYESAKIDEVRSTPVITILKSPRDLVEPLGRRTVRNTLIATLAGMILSSVIVLGLDAFNEVRTGGREDVGSFIAAIRDAVSDLPLIGRLTERR